MIHFPGPPVSHILFFKKFGAHRGMNVMSDFMKQDVPDSDFAQ